jgi:hypothetical protein
MPKKRSQHPLAGAMPFAACLTLALAAQPALASDAFRTGFATSGTLYEDIFFAQTRPNVYGGIGYKQAHIVDVTDANGHSYQPSPAFKFSNDSTVQQAYLYAGMVSETQHAGGRWAASIVVPFTHGDKRFTATNITPNPAYTPAATFLTQTNTGTHSRLDDIEISGGWIYSNDRDLKLGLGLALKTKTGGYDPKKPGENIGTGYYTLKPAVGAVYEMGAFSLAGKATLGINSTNKDANYRSGNVFSLEAAAGYKSPIGAFGLNLHSMRQIQDDTGTGVPYGGGLSYVSPAPADGKRIQYVTYSPFYMLPVKPLEGVLMVSLTKFQSSKYSQDYPLGFQIRFTRTFQ